MARLEYELANCDVTAKHVITKPQGSCPCYLLVLLRNIWKHLCASRYFHKEKCNIMAEGFRFIYLALGLVRLRTFRPGTWVSKVQTWAQVLTRVRGGCVVHRCRNKNPSEGMWMMSCTGSVHGGFGEIWKSQLSWELDSEREESTFGARWGETNLCTTGAAPDGWWGIWKSHHRKIV